MSGESWLQCGWMRGSLLCVFGLSLSCSAAERLGTAQHSEQEDPELTEPNAPVATSPRWLVARQRTNEPNKRARHFIVRFDDPRKPRELTLAEGDVELYGHRWTADGRFFAYFTHTREPEGSRHQLWLADAQAGFSPREIDLDRMPVSHPYFDGKQAPERYHPHYIGWAGNSTLVLRTPLGDGWNILSVDAETLEPRNLGKTEHYGAHFEPSRWGLVFADEELESVGLKVLPPGPEAEPHRIGLFRADSITWARDGQTATAWTHTELPCRELSDFGADAPLNSKPLADPINPRFYHANVELHCIVDRHPHGDLTFKDTFLFARPAATGSSAFAMVATESPRGRGGSLCATDGSKHLGTEEWSDEHLLCTHAFTAPLHAAGFRGLEPYYVTMEDGWPEAPLELMLGVDANRQTLFTTPEFIPFVGTFGEQMYAFEQSRDSPKASLWLLSPGDKSTAPRLLVELAEPVNWTSVNPQGTLRFDSYGIDPSTGPRLDAPQLLITFEKSTPSQPNQRAVVDATTGEVHRLNEIWNEASVGWAPNEDALIATLNSSLYWLTGSGYQDAFLLAEGELASEAPLPSSWPDND